MNVTSKVAYYGDEPKDFGDIIADALLMWNWEDIIGWKGFNKIDVNLINSTSGTDSEGNNGGDTTDPATGSDNGDDVSSATRNQNNDKNRNPGAYVGAGFAALTLMLVALFVIQHRRNKKRENLNDMKHLQMTDDEEDELVMNNATHDKSRSYIASDDEDIEHVSDNDNGRGPYGNDVTPINSGSTEVEALPNPPTTSYRQPQQGESYDESTLYRYPEKHLITHRISSYDSEFKKMSEKNNHRSYEIPDDTVEL